MRTKNVGTIQSDFCNQGFKIVLILIRCYTQKIKTLIIQGKMYYYIKMPFLCVFVCPYIRKVSSDS